MMPRRRKDRRRFNGVRGSFMRRWRLYDCQNTGEFSSVSMVARAQSQRGGNRLPGRCRAANLSPPGGKRAVTGTIEAQAAAVIRDAQILADQQIKTAERAPLRQFIAELY